MALDSMHVNSGQNKIMVSIYVKEIGQPGQYHMFSSSCDNVEHMACKL